MARGRPHAVGARPRHVRLVLVAPIVAALAGGCDDARRFSQGPPECERCHGGGGSAAPPASPLGYRSVADGRVGAHRAHLDPHPGAVRAPIGCDECHVVPERRDSPGHIDGGAAVVFGALATVGPTRPVWDRDALTCAATYCHGATLGAGGIHTTPVWTSVGEGQAACDACHGNPPPAPHPQDAACAGCHPATVRADGSIDLAGGHHIDGILDASTTCGSCHGTPPATGAHLAHAPFADPSRTAYGDQRILEDYAPAGGPAYLFGCGNCHPLDPARHMDAVVQVDLSPTSPAAGLRARNAPGAAYAGGACSGVYCHSSGQETPAYAATPAWTATPGGLGCGGCHGNPPQYPSGGAGAPDANSHLGLAEDGYEFGHFLGMPGPTHSSKHGGGLVWPDGEDAAPITCQTCHYETTDPAATGPSGFYWLDTTGTYAVPGGAAGREAWLAGQQCGYCHGSGGAAAGTGRVLPLRHVNGRREVAFDPRTALPAIAWLPAAPATPTGPYWMTGAQGTMPWPASVAWSGDTVSFSLAASTWDPATKRCSGVACHLVESPVWGTPYVYAGSVTCTACHPF